MGEKPSLTPIQRKLARHALGLENGQRKSYRNRFSIAPGAPDHAEWMRGDKVRTYRLQDDTVTDHRTERRTTWRAIQRGDFERLL